MSNRGFTLIELLIAVTILALIGGIVLLTLGNFRDRQAVKNAKSEIISALNLARTNSLNGLNDTVHGIHFDQTSFTFFSGASFVADNPENKAIDLPAVTVTASLTGGDNVVFDRLTGTTINDGTIVITSINAGEVATVTVLTSGLVSGQ